MMAKGTLRQRPPGDQGPRQHLRAAAGRRRRDRPGADRAALRRSRLRRARPRGQHDPDPGAALTAWPRANTAKPSTPHAADSHDLIRVHGARVNNLKDVSVEIPKRRLTVFTGVSGSGKSSLVFGTIAAESQRLINETYSAFVQGFMPTLARPDVDVLDGLTTAIIVDQERMGATPLDGRHRHRCERDAAHPVQPARPAAHRLAARRSRSTSPRSAASGAMTVERGDGKTVTGRRSSTVTGGMCPRCEGTGAVTDFDLTQLVRREQVAQRGRAHDPRLQHGRLVRPHLPRLRLLRSRQADPQVHEEGTARPALQGADQDQGRRHQPDLRGADPADPEVDARRRTSTRCSRTSAPSSSGRSRSRPAPSATAPGSARRRARRRSTGINIADACAMQISDLAAWVRGLDEPSVAPLLDGAAADPRLVRRDRARLSHPRPAVGHALRWRSAAHEDDPPPRFVRSPT